MFWSILEQCDKLIKVFTFNDKIHTGLTDSNTFLNLFAINHGYKYPFGAHPWILFEHVAWKVWFQIWFCIKELVHTLADWVSCTKGTLWLNDNYTLVGGTDENKILFMVDESLICKEIQEILWGKFDDKGQEISKKNCGVLNSILPETEFSWFCSKV